MDNDLKKDLSSRFKKIFANLPEKIRNEDIIIIIDSKPYTWNAVYFEVKNESELGEKMLKKLNELGIL